MGWIALDLIHMNVFGVPTSASEDVGSAVVRFEQERSPMQLMVVCSLSSKSISYDPWRPM